MPSANRQPVTRPNTPANQQTSQQTNRQQSQQTSQQPNGPQPFFHTTPAAALSHSTDKTIALGKRSFKIAYPGNADRLLDHPSTHSAFHADEYMPYWAELWPAATMLGEALLERGERENWPENTTALEIGCGVGLPGIVALSMGLHVIFSDYDATAVAYAASNATANGFNNFETLLLDWRVPPDFQVPLILAADVIYEERNIPPLIALIQEVLSSDGMCLLSDPDRVTRGGFCYALERAGLRFTRQKAAAPGPEDQLVKGSVYIISK